MAAAAMLMKRSALDWLILTVRNTQTLGRPDGSVSLGLWTVEFGPVSIPLDRKLAATLRSDIAAAEALLDLIGGES